MALGLCWHKLQSFGNHQGRVRWLNAVVEIAAHDFNVGAFSTMAHAHALTHDDFALFHARLTAQGFEHVCPTLPYSMSRARAPAHAQVCADINFNFLCHDPLYVAPRTLCVKSFERWRLIFKRMKTRILTVVCIEQDVLAMKGKTRTVTSSLRRRPLETGPPLHLH